MLKVVIILVICVWALEVESAIENKDVDAKLYGKAIGEVCNGDDSDCLCAGTWAKCGCPMFTSGPCKCTRGLKFTCVNKMDCPNRRMWGGQTVPGSTWRQEEDEEEDEEAEERGFHC